MNEQKLIEESLSEINEEKVRTFKAQVKAQIGAIASTQGQIANLQKQLETQKKALKDMRLEQHDSSLLE